MTLTTERPRTGSSGRAVRARSRRPDLPDVGADLRVQPGVRALPVERGRRDPRELTTEQCEAVIDELQRMQVFYVNIGGGEPTIRPDFWHLLEYAVDHQVGVKFSTNGVRITPERAAFLARATRLRRRADLARRRDRRGQRLRPRPGLLRHRAHRAARTCRTRASRTRRSSVVCTRQNIGQLDEFKALADQFGATLRLTRLRPSGRGADVWDELHPLPEQQRVLYDWLMAHGDDVLTGDSFFHLAAFGESLPGPQPLRRRPRGLPDRPGRRRLCLPVRDPRQLPCRQPARRRRLPAGLADLRAVPGPALAADRRRLREVRVLRLVPRRLHGREVLHRPAARRPGPRVRAGVRRARPLPATGRSRPRARTTPRPARPATSR